MKTKIKPYPIGMPTALYDAVAQVARDRAQKLKRPVYMKDVILAALTLDPDVAKYYNQNKRKEKS